VGRFLNDADSKLILVPELNISLRWECQGWNEESRVTRAVCRSCCIPRGLGSHMTGTLGWGDPTSQGLKLVGHFMQQEAGEWKRSCRA